MRRVVPALLCAAVVLGFSRAGEAAGSVFPYPYESWTLDNGLQVIVVPRRGTGQVAYYTLVRAGSRNEVEPGRSGYAHFFEHMMFRGTPQWPPERYEETLKRHGAAGNAYTDDDLTLFTTVGSADGLQDYVTMEADRFRNLRYGQDVFATEAAAVRAEYNQARSSPWQAVYEALLSTAFTRHSYRHLTIGTEADIREMPRGFAYSVAFFRKFYTPDNCAVIIVGDVDAERVRPLVENAYGGWQGRAAIPRTNREPAQRSERRAVVTWPTRARPRLVMAWHTPASTPATVGEAAVASLVDDLLFGETSPFHRSVVLEKGWCDDVSASFQDHREPYLLMLALVVRDAARYGDVEAAVDEAVREVAEHGVPAERLEAVKSHQRYALLADLEREAAIADTIANHVHLAGSLDWMDRVFAARAAVTPEDVRAFVARHLVATNRTIVTLRVPGAAADGGTP